MLPELERPGSQPVAAPVLGERTSAFAKRARASSTSRSSSARSASGRLWGDAHAARRLPRGPAREVRGSPPRARRGSTEPSIRTWRPSACQCTRSAACGFAASSSALRLSRFVWKPKPSSSACLRSTIRTDGRPSSVAVASATASGQRLQRGGLREPGLEPAQRIRARASLNRLYSCMQRPAPELSCARGDDAHDRAENGCPRAAVAGDPRAEAGRDREREVDRAAAWCARGPGRDAHRRRRQRLHRLHRRGRLPEHRPLASPGRRGGAGAARPLRPHRFHGRPLRALRRARREADCARAVQRSGEGGVLQRRHRGRRERGQVRPAVHRPAGRDRLRGRVPRSHPALDDAHLEAASLQARHGAAGARGLPGAVPAGLSRAGHGDRRSTTCDGSSSPTSPPRRSPRSSSSRSRARVASIRRRTSTSSRCGRSATSTGSS